MPRGKCFSTGIKVLSFTVTVALLPTNWAIGNYIQVSPNLRAAKPAGCNWCADSSGDCTCRLKLLNQDSSCRLQNLSTESELLNAYICVQN